jgi:hypothetical protein
MFYPIKSGTKILVGEGFQCYLPKIPHKSTILFSDQKKEDQYWRRQPIPIFYKDRSLEEEYQREKEYELVIRGQKKSITHFDPVLERYRRQEWHRRIFGVWFMNNGEPTYITNHHYWYLQWCQFDHKQNEGYPFYYEYSKKNFYIRQWCEENPKSLGYMMIAARGTGKTNEEIACVTNRATYLHKHKVAYQGKNYLVDTKGVLIQTKTVPLFNSLPDFFKPQYSHGTEAKNELIFTRPSTRGKEVRIKEFGPDLELNSRIYAALPKVEALDGATLNDILETEIGKCHPVQIADIFQRHLTNERCVVRNHRKTGMLRKESTVEEMDEGGDECLKLWKKSDPTILDGNGFTGSKIHRHLISALDTDTSLEDYIDKDKKNWGPPCDKYGNVSRSIAQLKITNDRDAVKNNLRELSSRMRKSPINETEAFIKDQSKSIFNIQILSTSLQHLRHEMVNPPYVTGNFYWLKERFGAVGFKADNFAGRFNVAQFPDEYRTSKNPDNWKVLNNFGKEWGFDRKGESKILAFPKNNQLFRIATDPIQYTQTKDPRASKASIHGFRLYDHSVDIGKEKSKWQSHNFVFEYITRPDDPMTYCEDLAMACFFWGCSVLPEKNIKTINQFFEQNGLEKFLAYPRDFVDGIGLDVQNTSDDAGLASTTEVIDGYIRELIPFINEHCMRMPFDRTIEDWMNFDPNNRTMHDPTVSSGLTLVHARKMYVEEDKTETKISDWFDRIDNSGASSKIIEEDY